MSMRNTVFIWLLAAAAGWGAGGDRVTVERNGRRIQRDGFLLEWPFEAARRLEDTHDVKLDLMQTPEGCAGYVRFMDADSCVRWVFRIYPRPTDTGHFFAMTADTARGKGRFHALDVIRTDTATHCALEWVVPWDSLAVGPDGAYEFGLDWNSPCGGAASMILVSGRQDRGAAGKAVPPRLANQVILIAALLLAFIYLKVRAKRYSRTRRKPF
jgi:hypothetical protein